MNVSCLRRRRMMSFVPRSSTSGWCQAPVESRLSEVVDFNVQRSKRLRTAFLPYPQLARTSVVGTPAGSGALLTFYFPLGIQGISLCFGAGANC